MRIGAGHSLAIIRCTVLGMSVLKRILASELLFHKMYPGDGSLSMEQKLHMVVEHFKNKGAVAVYRRDRGRLAPDGLTCVELG